MPGIEGGGYCCVFGAVGGGCDAGAPPWCSCSMPGMSDMACPLAGTATRNRTETVEAASAAWRCHPRAPQTRYRDTDVLRPMGRLNRPGAPEAPPGRALSPRAA